MGAAARPTAAAAIAAIKDRSSGIGPQAMELLILIGPDAKEAAPLLTGMVKDRMSYLRGPAARALGAIGPEAREAVPALLNAAAEKKEVNGIPFIDISAEAKEALPRIGSGAVAGLIQGLNHPNQRLRIVAVESLGRIGPEAKEAVSALLNLYRTTYRGSLGVGNTRPETLYLEDVEEALTGIGEAAVPGLVGLLKEKNGIRYQLEVVRFLGTLGEAARTAVPALAEAVKDPDSGLKIPAIEALGALGPVAKDSLPVLTEALQDPKLKPAPTAALKRIDPQAVDGKNR
jgi:HEAT repeat protein